MPGGLAAGRGSDGLISVTPYRADQVELLPLAVELRSTVTTGYSSFSALLKYRQDLGAGAPARHGRRPRPQSGFREDRLLVVRDGPVFVSYTNAGRIYDFDVDFWQSSPYLQLETRRPTGCG